MAFRLSVESEGHVWDTDTSQEKFDEKKFQTLVIENFSQGKPVVFSVSPVSDSSPELVSIYLGIELRKRLEKMGFDPIIRIENEIEDGSITESTFRISHR